MVISMNGSTRNILKYMGKHVYTPPRFLPTIIAPQ